MVDYIENLNLIEDNLFLGSITATQSQGNLSKLKIKTILSVMDVHIKNSKKFDSISYHWVMAFDFEEQDLLSYFEETNQIIALAQITNRPVLVHCMAGVSRSATIVIAYIMNKYRMSFREAFEFVQIKRSIIDPNEGFRQQLKLYEEMKFSLDPNNRQFRSHLLSKILFNWRTLETSVDTYFERRDYVENKRKVDIKCKYKCSTPYCPQELFTDLNLIDISYETRSQCKDIFIEPQKWMKQNMKDFIENKNNKESFIVKCPKCVQTIGQFKEDFRTFICDCISHKGLSFLYFKIKSNSVQTV